MVQKAKTKKSTEEKSAATEEKSVAYSTRFGLYDGTLLDGQGIARNNAQYYRMYRVNTDIRRAIKEKQETSMKKGYEIQQLVVSTGNVKKVQAPIFEEVMERSGGLRQLKNKMVRCYDLFGYFYLRTHYNARGIMKYSVLDPRYTSVVTDNDLKPLRYIFKDPAKKGITENIPAEDVRIFMEDEDMDNPVFGISPLETIVVDVLGDEEANISNYAYFQNDGIPSALYVLKDGMDTKQQKQVYDQIQETMKGGHNKHKSLASSAVTDVKIISNDHTDGNFESQRKTATNKVCVALGVPRTILGYVEDVNHSNGDSQYTKFIENTIRPLERTLTEIFTAILHDIKEYANLSFFILDEHIDDFEQRCKLARENVAQGIWTRNRALEYIGDGASEDDLADELTVPNNTRLLSDLTNGTAPDNTQVGTPTQPTGKNSEKVEVKITHITK